MMQPTSLASMVPDQVLLERVQMLLDRPVRQGPVLYWMSRDQRAEDNWALTLATTVASRLRQPVVVVFFLRQFFSEAAMGDRHYQMMLAGLRETRSQLLHAGIELFLIDHPADNLLPRLAESLNAGLIVTDFSPMREIRNSHASVVASCLQNGWPCPIVEMDAHNIVPWHQVSPKKEFAARTIRPKINHLSWRYLVEYPPLTKHPFVLTSEQRSRLLKESLDLWPDADRTDPFLPVSGARAAKKQLDQFIDSRLEHYGLRNDPTADVTSGLSPYFHFGQISPARVALRVLAANRPDQGFLEELIVRRELSDNFCAYEPQYDRFEGLPSWGQKTLAAHRMDPRARVYPHAQLEEAQTGDPLWNAAQSELLLCGRIAGYLRMYWAKKILEWRPDPEDAFAFAIQQNDRYALDGRDPNGYVGIAWSIGGLHDRPFSERPVFGQIRYMSYDGCRRKFDVQAYISRMEKRRLALTAK